MSVFAVDNAHSESGVALLKGISWRGFALVSLLFGIWALQWSVEPVRILRSAGRIEILTAWLSLWVVMLVGGLTLFVSSVVSLNLAIRAGIDKAWIVLPVAIVGCLAATAISAVTGAGPTHLGFDSSVFSAVAFWADWAMAIAVGYLVLHRIDAARTDTHRLELCRKAREVRQTRGRLTVLEAQIEPHFLFNTLSNIRRLCQHDLASGRAMLAQLSRYLEAALPKMRRDHAPLADEIDLAMAYLDLQKIRMGARLSVWVRVPKEHLDASVPTMMLVTLVENAIKHGLSPLPEGGSVGISSRRDGDSLHVSVMDTGRGFIGESGSGVGLANIRARLSALYGDKAALRLGSTQPRGVQATLVLPRIDGNESK